jgi:hypothetical protein
MPIIHVHGQLAYLPWQDAAPSDMREYKPNTSRDDVEKAVRHIKIISEDVEANFAKARDLMHDAQQIVLLGFGYHKLNMERLNIPFSSGGPSPVVFGTSHGMTRRKVQEIGKAYPRLALCNLTCKEFFENITAFKI